MCLAGVNEDLFEAAYKGDVAADERLLKAVADMNAKDGFGMTALRWSAVRGHTAEVEQLRKAGADVNTRNEFGYTALMLAARYGHTAAV